MMINVTRNHVDHRHEPAADAAPGSRSPRHFSVGSADFGGAYARRHSLSGRFRRQEDRRGFGLGSRCRGAGLRGRGSVTFFVWPRLRGQAGRLQGHRILELLSLILSHEEPRVWLSTRGPQGWNQPLEVAGKPMSPSNLGFSISSLPLADLYDGGRGAEPSMTLKARVIPCLDVHDGRVVKGVNFLSISSMPGDPSRGRQGL